MPAPSRIAVDDLDGVPVVRFLDRQLYDDRTVREVGDALMSTATANPGPFRLILDFSGVTMISSALIGRLVLLQRKADASGGTLRLCDLGKPVFDALKTTNLDRILKIARDRREAREAFGD